MDLLVLFGRDENSNLTIMAAYANGATLSGVEQGSELLFSFGGGDLGHVSRIQHKMIKIDKMLILINLSNLIIQIR